MDNSTTTAVVDSTHALNQHRVFEVLRNGRRRFILMYLYQSPQQSAPLPELIDELAACTEADGGDSDQRKAVYASLYQNHLPRLEQYELIKQKNGTGQITLTDAGSMCVQYLRPVFDEVRAWPRLVRVLTVVAGVLFVLAAGNVLVLGPEPLTIALVVTLAFLFVSIRYYVDARRISVDPCHVVEKASEQ